MRVIATAPLALVCAFAVGRTAAAGLVGAEALIGPEQHPDAGVVTIRVHLIFDNELDQVLAISGNEDVSRLCLEIVGGVLRQNCDVAVTGCICDYRTIHDLGGDSWVNLGEHIGDTTGSGGGDLCNPKGVCCVAGDGFCDIDGYFDRDPGTPVLPDEDGRILIAQYSLPTATTFSYIGTCDYTPGGADGFVSERFAVKHMTCLGDLDASSTVDFNDVLALLAAWGPAEECPPHTAPDLDKDCDVDFGDLLILLSRWGACG